MDSLALSIPLRRRVASSCKEKRKQNRKVSEVGEGQRKRGERRRKKKKRGKNLTFFLMRLSLACLAASAARTVSRRAQRGIYAGKDVRSGNKVSEDGGNR